MVVLFQNCVNKDESEGIISSSRIRNKCEWNCLSNTDNVYLYLSNKAVERLIVWLQIEEDNQKLKIENELEYTIKIYIKLKANLLANTKTCLYNLLYLDIYKNDYNNLCMRNL